jgi:hypothetical protein
MLVGLTGIFGKDMPKPTGVGMFIAGALLLSLGIYRASR